MKKTLLAIAVSTLVATNAVGKDIVDTAVAAGSFTTLATALQAAGLVDTLKGEARSPSSPRPTRRSPSCRRARSRRCWPTGQAAGRADLPRGAGWVMSKDVKAGTVKTVQGSNLNVTTMGGVKVNSANVTTVDIVADNGVIHVIDTVVLPK